MPLNLPLDTAEKYLWTGVEFLRLGPRKFRKNLRTPSGARYLTAAQVFFGTLMLCTALLVISLTTLHQMSIPGWSFAQDDTSQSVGAHIVLVATSVIAGAATQRLVLWWPLGSPANVKDMLTGKFYCTVILVACAAADVLLSSALSMLIPHVAPGARAKVLILAGLIEWLVVSGIYGIYDFWSICAFCRLRLRRLLEGIVIFVTTCTVLGGTIGALVGGLLGGISDAMAGGAGHSWNAFSVTGFVQLFLMILAVGLACLPSIVLFFILRRRIPKLRQAVLTEYDALGK